MASFNAVILYITAYWSVDFVEMFQDDECIDASMMYSDDFALLGFMKYPSTDVSIFGDCTIILAPY